MSLSLKNLIELYKSQGIAPQDLPIDPNVSHSRKSVKKHGGDIIQELPKKVKDNSGLIEDYGTGLTLEGGELEGGKKHRKKSSKKSHGGDIVLKLDDKFAGEGMKMKKHQKKHGGDIVLKLDSEYSDDQEGGWIDEPYESSHKGGKMTMKMEKKLEEKMDEKKKSKKGMPMVLASEWIGGKYPNKKLTRDERNKLVSHFMSKIYKK